MRRREFLAVTCAGSVGVSVSAQPNDDLGETPNVRLPRPEDFRDSPELTLPAPLEPISVGRPPAEWDGTKSPRIGEGPCGIAKEFAASGPVPEFLDDDDSDCRQHGDAQEDRSLTAAGQDPPREEKCTPGQAMQAIASLQKEFGGMGNPKTSYYEMGIAVAEKKVLPGPMTRILGYGPWVGKNPAPQWPAPFLVARLGHPMVIRFINTIEDYISVHLHGTHGPAHSDGHPAFVVPRPTKQDGEQPRGYGQNHRDYFYPHTIPAITHDRSGEQNRQTGDKSNLDVSESPSTMWYHDHSMDVTGPHAMLGMAGFCPIYDDLELDLLGRNVLPFCGEKGKLYVKNGSVNRDAVFEGAKANPFDIPIAIQDRRFSCRFGCENRGHDRPSDPDHCCESRNQLLYTVKGHNGFLGHEILLNGALRPRLTVVPRKYRLRFLNGSNARFYKLALYFHFEGPEEDGKSGRLLPLRKEMADPAWLRIGKDTWLYPKPVRQDKILLGMANRADVVVDFEAIKNHFENRRRSDDKFREETKDKKLAIYLVNLLDQDSGRGPRAKLDDGNDQDEAPPVEPIENVNVDNDREDFAKGELNEPWLLMKFEIASQLGDLPKPPAGDRPKNAVWASQVFKKLGYTDMKDVPRATVEFGTPLRPHRPILREEITQTREVLFHRGNGIWQINGKVVDEFLSNFVPKLNTAECWILENGGGGWWHPIHIHLESHQQIEFLSEVDMDEALRLLSEVVLRTGQAAKDEEIIGEEDASSELRKLVLLLKESIALVRTRLTKTPDGRLDLATTELAPDVNDPMSLQQLTRIALEKIEEFAERRSGELPGKPRPKTDEKVTAYLRLIDFYGNVRNMVVDLNSESVVEAGRIWKRISIPPWDRFKSDTTILGPRTRVRIYMKFRTFDGPFVFHCHNLEHEDMRMMFTFDPRFTPAKVEDQGDDASRRWHAAEHVVTYRHPFRFSGDHAPEFDLRPHLDSIPDGKRPPWHETPQNGPVFPRAHPIWGGWDQEL